MEKLHEVREALLDSLDELDTVKGGKLKMGELEAIKMISSSLDHINNVCDHDGDEGYSRRGYSRNGYSGARRRDSRGRYSRNNYGSKAEMMDHVERAMSAAPDKETLEAAREFMEKLERM